jgi:transketolase
LPPVGATRIEAITAVILQRHAGGGALSPAAVTFLLRRYADTGDAALRPAVEEGLTAGLEILNTGLDPRLRSEWLSAMNQALALSDDPSLQPAIAASLAAVIDDLERLIGRSYEPGYGLAGGTLADHAWCALALLAAFDLTGRLPYSMLAEELVQFARRQWWRDDRGAFDGDLRANAVAARVLCGLAILRQDPQYAEAAAVAHDTRYAHQVGQILAALAIHEPQRSDAAADYGLALLDWFALRFDAHMDRASLIPALQNVATRLRIDSVTATSEAGSGHPTSCCSAADIMAAVFFAEMRFDPKDPHHPGSDRFILSKGHAAPILYAAWAEAGAFDRAELLNLRKLSSDLEGHPTPRLPFVDVATGSLGQGICAAIGSALNARRIGSDYRTYCILGDGESAEGSVWEAADIASIDGLDNLCGITDVNALGQSKPTMWQHDMDQFARRWAAFGWHAIVVDGHDINAILDALAEARATAGKPTMILARTIKGKGVSFTEGKPGWHGRAFKKGEELDRALAELQGQFVDAADVDLVGQIVKPTAPSEPAPRKPVAEPSYKMGEEVATREAYGVGLAKLGEADSRIVALDADVKNSTFSDKFEKVFPDRFYQNYIAEQVMVGSAMGLAARGAIPFPSTFACFLTRAADFVRMAAISNVNVKLAGSHAGVSIGEDGPSQMALEDLAMFRAEPNYAVLYPCDAVSTERLLAAMVDHAGPAYMRTSRPKTPVIYSNDETFTIGGLKVLRESKQDVATVVGAGVTLFEALKAYDTLKASGTSIRVIDLYSLQPIDGKALIAAGTATGGQIITVEDHYPAGGIGDAVSAAVAEANIRVHRIAVREIPRSGKPEELLDRFGISAPHIVDAVNALAKTSATK